MSHTRHIDRAPRPFFLSRVSGPEGYSEGFRLAQKAPLFLEAGVEDVRLSTPQ